jgi:hypothetical protein
MNAILAQLELLLVLTPAPVQLISLSLMRGSASINNLCRLTSKALVFGNKTTNLTALT